MTRRSMWKMRKDSSEACQAFRRGQERSERPFFVLFARRTPKSAFMSFCFTHTLSLSAGFGTLRPLCEGCEKGWSVLAEDEEGVDKWMTVCGCEDVTAHRFHWWAGTGLCTKQAVHSNATVLSAPVRQSCLWMPAWWESVSLSLPLTVTDSSCSECVCVCVCVCFLYLSWQPATVSISVKILPPFMQLQGSRVFPLEHFVAISFLPKL